MNEPTITQIKDTTGNPAPLGLLGFGMTTVLLNLHNAGFFELNAMILAMGICYGGIAQIIAGAMEWKKSNTFAATAFISYGLFWLSLVTLINWVANVILPVYAASQVAAMALRLGVFSLVHPTSGWLRHFVTAALCLMVSGLLRLAEFFVAQGTAGVT